MILDCDNCGARYNIQDSLIPPQGARVKCKKCSTVLSVPPPVVELAPQDLELIPPTPAPSAPETVAGSGGSIASGFETAAESSGFETAAAGSGYETSSSQSSAPAASTPESGMPLEHFPKEPAPEASRHDADDSGFERAGAPARFGSPPAFTESASPSAPDQGSTMTVESPMAVSTPTATEPEEQTVSAATQDAPAPTEEPAPSTGESVSTLPTGTPLPEGLSPEARSAHEKARRLARVLASDIAIYNRDKKERGIREGNLVAMLGYEIKKSWEIYKERVGSDFANSTPYFRDALNEMLAEGKKIF